jgi:predicted nucleic acid-binding protein
LNVVDSSAWLEYFADGANARHFERAILARDELVVPSLAVYEVFKRVCAQRGEQVGLEAAAVMRQGRVVPLDDVLALEAARLSLAHALPMADSVMLATARTFDATLWTQDGDFAGLEGVRYFPK